MRKNSLYTVNRFNMPMFMPERKNSFDDGGWTWDSSIYGDRNSKGGWFGLTKGNNPFSKGNLAAALNGENNLTSGILVGASNAAGNIAGNIISDGFRSGAGSAIGSLGSAAGTAISTVNPVIGAAVSAGSQLLGGLTNRAFGMKTDEQKLSNVNQSIAELGSFNSNAGSFDLIQGPSAMSMDTGVYKGGWFSGGKARRRNNELRNRLSAALGYANRSVENNINNLAHDQLNDALMNYAAFGGLLDFGGATGLMQQDKYIDAINKRSSAIADKSQGDNGSIARTFDNGGLQMTFLDSFGSDPIGAVVRYNMELDRMAAEREERNSIAAREREYKDMKDRIASLETQNQGLQSLMSAMPALNIPDYPVYDDTEYSEPAVSVSYPSRAAYNSNWDYIEDQLRRSGRFNDVQIQGIKYNLQRESGIGKADYGDNGTARGLAQWRGNRIPKDMSLEGQTKYLIDTLSRYDGREHWIGKDNYAGFLNARTPEEAHYWIAKGYERPNNSILKRLKVEADRSLGRRHALGGVIETHGSDFTNGLMEINEGGSHEDNPLEGVPMGIDSEGIPNLVEEGETVYNNYVFSDRMEVPDFMYRELGLGGIARGKRKHGISFADASKKLAQESSQRPNDPISQAGLEASLGRLAEIQETERLRKQAEEYGGINEFAFGGRKGNMFDGRGSSPQTLNISLGNDKSLVRRMFGDNAFTDTMENIADAINDPIGYFAGDEVDSIMDNISRMAEPQLEKFFSTPIGQSIASVIAGMEDNGNAQEAGVNRWYKATGRMAKPVQKSIVNAAKRQMAKSRQAAKGQIKTPKAKGKPDVITENMSPAQSARQSLRGRADKAGWSTDAGQATIRNVGSAKSRPLNPKVNGTAGRGNAVPDAFAGLEGTLNFPSQASRAARGLWAVPVIGLGGLGAYGLTRLGNSIADDSSTALPAASGNTTLPVSAPFNSRGVINGVNDPLTNYIISGLPSGGTSVTSDRSSNLPHGNNDSAVTGDIDEFEPIPPKEEAALIAASEEPETEYAVNFGDPEAQREADSFGSGIYDDFSDALNKKERSPYDTWMRYAPVIGAGIMSMTDALGITNRPDYSYVRGLEAASQRAGFAPNINYKPIGNYLKYQPLDRMFYANQLSAQTGATRRALANQSGGNRGVATAGILSADYNAQNALGNLNRQAEEYNLAQRERVADFNRRTNMFNSQMALEAAMANARYTQTARQMGLSGLAQAAALRDSIDARTGAARSANLTNFLNSLGNIGRENFALNQLYGARAAHNGYYPTLSGGISRD